MYESIIKQKVIGMAGYDLDFETKVEFRLKVQEFLRFLQLFYRRYDLKLRFKTTVKNESSLIVYVTVDGSLSTMQYVSRILPRVIDIYLLFNTYKQDVIYSIIIPLVKANQK